MKDHMNAYGYTATGRQPSTPAMQTLNKRSPRPGKIVDADYSKIEERVLAHVIADAERA